MTSATRSTPARLARLHLRTGSLSLARAELETLAGQDSLDDEALIDLAEVRWRTGDLAGAGDAARAYLETGHESSVALVIAAEAAEILGRAAEAHRLVARALEHPDAPLDEVFAGIPRSTIWPGEAHRAVQGPLFTVPGTGEERGSVPLVAGSLEIDADEDAVVAAAVSAWTGTASGGLWDDRAVTVAPSDMRPPAGSPATEPDGELPSGGAALEAGRIALADGRTEEAVIHLSLALRLRADLAPLVLDAVADLAGSAIDLLRGDALRLAGSEGRARRAWAAALGAVTADGQARHHSDLKDTTTPVGGEHGLAVDPEETT